MSVGQQEILQWAVDTFGAIAQNVDERAARLVEEAIEIAQVHGVKPETISKIAQRVYSRPVGSIGQEVGGCGIALLAVAEISEVSFETEIKREWERVSTLPREYWARKHAEKVAAGTANLTPASLHSHTPGCASYNNFDKTKPNGGVTCDCGAAERMNEAVKAARVIDCESCGLSHPSDMRCPE